MSEAKTFVKELVKNINGAMSLKQYYEDDRNATKMIFSMDNFPTQFQPDFCPCCGDYILCDTPGAPKCKNKDHIKIINVCREKIKQKLMIRNIEHWIDISKSGDLEKALKHIKHLVNDHFKCLRYSNSIENVCKIKQTLLLRDIEIWINRAKAGEFEKAINFIKYLVNE